MKTKKKKKTKLVNLPQRCVCGSKRGTIEIDNDDSCTLYLLRCTCGHELDHSLHKDLLGRKI